MSVMSTVLYSSPIFGPVHSRRLGVSLGINLMPADGKICTFDCIYCECGRNCEHHPHHHRPTRKEVYDALRATGIPVLAAVRWGIVPQILPHFVSAILYRMDINLREAAVLGLVGAGGIGTPLVLAMNHYEWKQAGALLWGLILLAGAAGAVSEKYRKAYRMRKAG